MKSRITIFSLLFLLICGLAGCSSGGAAGVFRSTDGGKNYAASNTLDENKSIAGKRVVSLANNLSNPNKVYAGVDGMGIVVSQDGGAVWRSTSLSTGQPLEIVVHPQNDKIITALQDKTVVRSRDDGANFETIYADPAAITALAIDPAAPINLWIGTEAGQVIKSINDGRSWSVTAGFASPITDILVSPLGSAILVGTARDGLYISSDKGTTFTNKTPLKEVVKELAADAEEIVGLAQSTQVGSPVLMATAQGLLSSQDLGTTWKFILDPISSGEIVLSGIFINPKENSQVLIVGGSTVAKSSDGGSSWEARAIPTQRILGALTMVDPQTILVGVSSSGPGFVERTLKR